MAGVMLVEGYALFRQALAVVLDSEGLRVVAQAGSLAEAREAAASQAPIRVIVAEVALPDASATDPIRELRRSLPDSKVMVLTASIDPGVPTRALEAGASAVLRKAVSKDEILAAVRNLLDAEERAFDPDAEPGEV